MTPLVKSFNQESMARSKPSAAVRRAGFDAAACRLPRCRTRSRRGILSRPPSRVSGASDLRRPLPVRYPAFVAPYGGLSDLRGTRGWHGGHMRRPRRLTIKSAADVLEDHDPRLRVPWAPRPRRSSNLPRRPRRCSVPERRSTVVSAAASKPARRTAALATANPVRRRSCHGMVDDAWPWLGRRPQGEDMPGPSPSAKAYSSPPPWGGR
jgi:hypothetical protein